MYSYFLILKSYINTYISIIYTESTVRNVKPQGNHNKRLIPSRQYLLLETLNRKVITTATRGDVEVLKLLETLNRKVITTQFIRQN